jgi:transposase-like protein
VIIWNAKKRTYVGTKFVNGVEVAEVQGDEWYTFFFELTSKGLYNGEACMFGVPDYQDVV